MLNIRHVPRLTHPEINLLRIVKFPFFLLFSATYRREKLKLYVYHKSAFNESTKSKCDAFPAGFVAGVRWRLVETAIVLGTRRGVGTSRAGAGETGHTAGEIHSTRHAAGAAESRGHLINESHYLGIVLVLEYVRRIRRDILEGLRH